MNKHFPKDGGWRLSRMKELGACRAVSLKFEGLNLSGRECLCEAEIKSLMSFSEIRPEAERT